MIYIRLLEIQKVLKKDKLKKKENLLNYKSILLYFITYVCSTKLAFFYAFFAPAGTIAFNQHGCPFFMPFFKFACRWASVQKIQHWFCSNFCF
ncbi:hypothetical protein L086_0100605 [Staphylococcus epidermidis UC7032]|nr:hypothetical protein L086_0100605 [Staphylococcus epidermidis UC7032]